MSAARRKTFAAREDLIDRVKEIARGKGYSLYDYVNELFEAAIEAEEAGATLKGLLDEALFIRRVREAGFVLAPGPLFYEMARLALSSRAEAERAWKDAGKWIAIAYKAKFGDGALAKLQADLPRIFWDVPDFEVRLGGGRVEIEATSPRFAPGLAELFLAMLEGVLEGLGVAVEAKGVEGKTLRVSGRAAHG